MADDTFAYPTATSDGGQQTSENVAPADIVVDGAYGTPDKEDAPAAAAGDRDAAVELLLEEIRGLKDERSDLQRERSDLEQERADLQRDLADAREKLAGAESHLKAVADQATLLEGELRLAHDDLSSANIDATEHEEEVRRLNNLLKEREVKIGDLEAKVKALEEELRVSKQKARDAADIFAAREEEMAAKIAEFKSSFEVGKKEKGLEIDGKEDSRVSPMHTQALGVAAVVGVVALAAGTVVCLHVAKRS